MKDWTVGDVSGLEELTDDDHLHASHINELRRSIPISQASFTIFVDGSDYKATDGTGALVSTDTDAAVVFRYAISHLPTFGGLILVGAGVFNFYTMEFRTPINNVFLLGYGVDNADNIHIRGAGMDATVLKYVGDNYFAHGTGCQFIGTYYDIVGGGNGDNLSVKDLTIDCNGLLNNGIVLSYVTNFLVEGVKFKNVNIFETESAKCDLGVYGSYGVLRNLYFDPPMVTDETVGTANEYLNTALLFDSNGCYNVFCEDLFFNGGNVSIAKSAIAYEDSPYNIFFYNIHIRNYVSSAICGAAPYPVDKANHWYDTVWIENCLNAINMIMIGAYKYNSLHFNNIHIDGMTNTEGTGIFGLNGKDHWLSNIYITNSPASSGPQGAIYLTNADNIHLSNINIFNPQASGLLISDGCSRVTVEGGLFTGALKNGIEIRASGGGAAPTDTKILNCHVYNTKESEGGVFDCGVRTVIRGCNLSDNQTPATQERGIYSTGTAGKYTDNYFIGNLIAGITVGSGSPIVKRNIGCNVVGGDD